MAAMFGEWEGQLLGRTQRILLELSTVLYFTAKNSAIPLVQQYIYFLVAKKHAGGVAGFGKLNGNNLAEVNDGGYRNISSGGVTSQPQYDKTLADRVNEESSLIILYLNMAELLPAAIVVLLLGFWSDLTGKRKFLMWLPCVGNALYALGFLLPLYICDGNIDSALTKAFFVVASIMSGLSGSVPGFLSGNASYISDTDTRGRRTLRLAIVELSIGMTFGLSNLLNGFWIRATQHYEQPLWFVFGCSIVPFFILFFCLKEPNGELTSQLGQPTAFKDFRAIRNVFGCTTVSQKKLWAIFVAFQIYVFVQQGQERTFVLFLQNSPLYWKSVQIGLFLFVLYALSGLGCWPGVPLLHRVCDDISIAIIAMISKAVGSFLLAFARNDAMVYLSSVVQLFHLTPYAVARSMASKEVGENEQGSVYALLHSVQSVAVFLGPLVHNAVFAVTLHSMSGLVFLVSGPVLVVPVLLLVWIKHKDRNQGYFSMEGANAPQPLTPTMTPLSEVSGFAQHPPDENDDGRHLVNPP